MSLPKNEGIRLSQQDLDRFWAMDELEQQLRLEGYRAIAGVDEAGRGPLAGPVVAAACILPSGMPLYGLNDSKKMTAKRRIYLDSRIRELAPAWSIAMVGPEEIDRVNILEATKEAMRRALAGLPVKPDVALIDALPLKGLDYPVWAPTKGDSNHNAIAAASILAKVARDQMMESWDKVYPQYGFASHKGYGTPAHQEAIRQYGPCPIHRVSFLTKIMATDRSQPSCYRKGLDFERLVARDLIGRGHLILEHRYRVEGLGEIDFITQYRDTYWVIECKGRGGSSGPYGGREEALGQPQTQVIRQVASFWLDRLPGAADLPVQFLYASAALDGKGRPGPITYCPF